MAETRKDMGGHERVLTGSLDGMRRDRDRDRDRDRGKDLEGIHKREKAGGRGHRRLILWV